MGRVRRGRSWVLEPWWASWASWSLWASGTLAGCAATLGDHVELQPSGSDVALAMEPPSMGTYRLLGPVVGEATAADPEVAQQSARNDIRNKAAAMGAVLVTIDQNLGQPMLLQDRTKVTLVGRAYKPVD